MKHLGCILMLWLKQKWQQEIFELDIMKNIQCEKIIECWEMMQGKRWSYHDQDSFKGALSSYVWFDNVYLRGWTVSGMGVEPSSWWRWAARNSYSFLSFPACESSAYTLPISIYLLWVICLGDNIYLYIRVISWSNESDVVTFQDGKIRTEGKRRESKESSMDFSIHWAYDYSQIRLKIWVEGTSLAAQWLRLHASNVRGTGLISGQGTKIPCAV